MNTICSQSHVRQSGVSRRAFLKTTGATASLLSTGAITILGQAASPSSNTTVSVTTAKPTYDNDAKGIRILPGQWRPHYPWEHIVWISPSWPSQDYLWLDFPEAIFTNQGLLFLSHINPAAPAVYPDWPTAEWRKIERGVAFERTLPNGVSFGGSVTKASETTVSLELHITNGAAQPLKDITLQTCAFLRAIKEFSEFTRDNKFVHVSDKGWTRYGEATALPAGSGPYRVGWRKSGKLLADWPVLVTVSNQAERLVAMSWQKHTLSMVSNPNHPCMHADPQFKDLEPGERASIRGKIVFFEGKLAEFDYAKHVGDGA